MAICFLITVYHCKVSESMCVERFKGIEHAQCPSGRAWWFFVLSHKFLPSGALNNSRGCSKIHRVGRFIHPHLSPPWYEWNVNSLEFCLQLLMTHQKYPNMKILCNWLSFCWISGIIGRKIFNTPLNRLMYSLIPRIKTCVNIESFALWKYSQWMCEGLYYH